MSDTDFVDTPDLPPSRLFTVDDMDEIETIEGCMKTQPETYWGDGAMQTRLRELYGARDSGVEPSAKPATAERAADGTFLPKSYSGRIEQIQAMMHTPEYWASEKLQAEYRDLISKRDGIPADNASFASPEDAVARILPGVEDARGFVLGWDVLAPAIREAAINELALPAPIAVRPANESELKAFEGIAEHLLAHWGPKDSANRVGMFWERWHRAKSALAPDAAAEISEWFMRLPDSDRAAVAQRLAH